MMKESFVALAAINCAVGEDGGSSSAGRQAIWLGSFGEDTEWFGRTIIRGEGLT